MAWWWGNQNHSFYSYFTVDRLGPSRLTYRWHINSPNSCKEYYSEPLNNSGCGPKAEVGLHY